MIRRLTGPLPAWAHRGHPVLRYELGTPHPATTRGRLLQWGGVLVLVVLLLAVGVLLATRNLTQPAGQSLTESVHAVVYWPVLLIQFVVGMLALALTLGAVVGEQRQPHWDSLRTTAHGVELALRARWTAVFYRLRWLLFAIIAIRALLIVGILYDLTSFQGRYLDLLLNGITPELSLAVGVLLLSLLMTATLIIPLTSIGLDAAFGLLLSTVIRQPAYVVIVQVVIVLLRAAVIVGLAQAMTQFVDGLVTLERPLSTLLVTGFGMLGDGGLAYLNLGLFGDLWARAPWSVLVPVGLLVFVLLQALLADRMVVLAVRRAERLD